MISVSGAIQENTDHSLPEGWQWKRLVDVCGILMGQSPPSSTYNEQGIGLPFYQGKAEFGLTYPTPKKWCSALQRVAKAGDILMSVRAPVGPVNITESNCCIGRGLSALRPKDDISIWYLFRYLQSIEDDIASLGQGSTFSSISRKEVEHIHVPVPPLVEQKRISNKLEIMLNQTRTARAALERVPALLKALRQSVLAAALRGELTARDPNDEPAAALLERIHAERRRRWEADLRARGKDPARVAYPAPAAPDPSGLPALPEGWAWTTVSDVAQVRLGRQRSPSRSQGPYMRPYLRAANVTWNGFDLSDVKEMDFTPDEQEVYDLRNGDILLNEASGSVSEVGKPAIWRGEIPDCYFQNTLIRVRSEGPISEYLHFHFYYDALTSRFGHAAQGVAINHIGAKGLSDWIIALPPIEEQRRIVTKLESSFAEIKMLENAVRIASQQVDALEQSALVKAFQGAL